ncbi:MAG TPA: DUF4136 domain-containing protein [Steroidobacteraceae bacterium]|nr:DUF4136 domain-containing protein [Steroidobacteraceae bacterium]
MSRYAKLSVMLASGSLALGACTTLHVTTDVNPTYSVASCRTYAFAHEHVANADQPAAYGNPLNADRLRNAIAGNFAARGITQVNEGAADCIVGYALGSRQVFNDYYAGWGPGWGWGWGPGWRGGYWGYDGPWVEDETRIAIDVFDAKSRKAMWHGAVSQTVSDLRGPNAEAKINAATAAIFAKMPVAVPAAVVSTPPPAYTAPAGESAHIFMYPKNGQSDQQQATDRRECEQWASQHAGGAPGDYQRAMIACVTGRGYSVN